MARPEGSARPVFEFPPESNRVHGVAGSNPAVPIREGVVARRLKGERPLARPPGSPPHCHALATGCSRRGASPHGARFYIVPITPDNKRHFAVLKRLRSSRMSSSSTRRPLIDQINRYSCPGTVTSAGMVR